MRNFPTLLAKELRRLFSTFVAYALISVLLLIMGYSFTSILFFQRGITLVHALAQAGTLMLLLIPILTMRQFSEERESGALDLIFSTPTTEAEIVLAKFFSGLVLLMVMLLSSVIFPLSLWYLGNPDFGAIVSGYVGLLLMSLSLLALGTLIASWIANPLVAAMVSLALFLLLWMIEVFGNVAPIPLRELLEACSYDLRFSRFLSGAIYLSDCSFFILITLAALILSVRAVSIR